MESYLTDPHPTIEQWIEINRPFFHLLRGQTDNTSLGEIVIAPFVDFDEYAASIGRDVRECFDELVERVGDLGVVRLELQYSAADDAYHVTFVYVQADNAR